MVLARDVRQQKLEKLRKTGEATSHSKLYYKGTSGVHPVHLIDLDLLVYNRHNGRLESEMLTWQQDHAVDDNEYNSELHKLIDSFLWNTNTTRNRRTLQDLALKGQQRPGIVTLDGVIIDGNRRAMLLRRLEAKQKQKQYFEAVILPDAYDENEEAIVRLETQYQLGEDAILDYGPLEKYLHVKRLTESLGIHTQEIAQLMGETEAEVKRLIGIMSLMDEYLDHIGCPGLYNLLKEEGSGTKEGMFVDLYSDLNRFEGGRAQIQWTFDPEVDLLELKTIQFDYIRFGSGFTGTNKTYRAISHEGSGKKSFFAHEDIWRSFSKKHRTHVDPITSDLGSLQEYAARNSDLATLFDAAKHRDDQWKESVRPVLKENFGVSEDALDEKVEELEPRRLLTRALNALRRINAASHGLLADTTCRDMVKEISRLTFAMKKKIERHEKSSK